MVKIVSIKPTKNAKFIQVELRQVLKGFDAVSGLKNERVVFALASAEKFTGTEGQVLEGDIKMQVSDEPMYEGHKPFEANGKYYKAVLA